ncbi:transposase [Ekhidna sp. To15]|uniref:transposase n=1 Tax=Ekhidna sp. To15 TaxID=3395267 RepID=UPI003F51E30D
MECKYCGGKCHKKGVINGNQQYWCTQCHKYQRAVYKYEAYKVSDEAIANFTKEGVGIRSTSRLLNISQSTVISRIRKIATDTKKPPISQKKLSK